MLYTVFTRHSKKNR